MSDAGRSPPPSRELAARSSAAAVWSRLRRAWVLHPFLYAVAPILLVASANVGQIAPGQLVLPLAAAIGFAGASLALLRALLGSYERAAIVTTTLLVLIFSGGALHDVVHGLLPGVPAAALFTAEWAIVAGVVAAVWKFVCHVPAREESATTLLFVMALFSFLDSAEEFFENDRLAVLFQRANLAETAAGVPHPTLAADSAQFPDIYYIIADAYPRDDVLQRVYGYDNGEFLRWLEDKGFYVARESWSNYPMTFMSLASSLSMRYVNDIAENIARDTRGRLSTHYRLPYYRLIYSPEVAARLQQKGYLYAQTLTHWGGTDKSVLADITFKHAPFFEDEFSGTLANLTLLRAFAPRLVDLHRHTAQKTVEIAELPEPTFAFVHMLLPHNPYVFDAAGNVAGDFPLTLTFKGQEDAWRLKQPFVEQLRYTNVMLREIIEGILARSDVPPIIILQGDHGSAATWFDDDGHKNEAPDPKERLGILNAYLVPPAVRERLYPAITPVNTFRAVLSAQFGDDLPLLPDRNYFSYYDDPQAIADVTDDLR